MGALYIFNVGILPLEHDEMENVINIVLHHTALFNGPQKHIKKSFRGGCIAVQLDNPYKDPRQSKTK